MNEAGTETAVLVVEDEAIILMLLAESLVDAGFTVEQATSADEAMAILASSETIGAVVTDVRMPGSTDGLGLAGWMRERAPLVPIMLTSGFTGLRDVESINPAIVRVVSKPYEIDDVVRWVASVLMPDGPDRSGLL